MLCNFIGVGSGMFYPFMMLGKLIFGLIWFVISIELVILLAYLIRKVHCNK